MCGISGYVMSGISLDLTDRMSIISKMTRKNAMRGPDAENFWNDELICLGHRRLSIIDVINRSDQPMISDCGEYIIVFNGEIYNYQELRDKLIQTGSRFNTESDTEVILNLYKVHGKDFLNMLRGMFAFAIWDKRNKNLFMARDPYGIKPLYYTLNKHGFFFSSSVESIIASDLVTSEIEEAGLVGFLLTGSVPEPWTMYKNVFALTSGAGLNFCLQSQIVLTKLIDIKDNWLASQTNLSDDKVQILVSESVKSSVIAHLKSDVPICIFLSGGIDSCVLAGHAIEAGASLTAITLSFQEFNNLEMDEVPRSREFTAQYSMNHKIFTVSRREFVDDIDKILDSMDQPSIDGINTWYASKFAAKLGFKVAISGVGGDELFYGYRSFYMFPMLVKLFKKIYIIPTAKFICKIIFNTWAIISNNDKYKKVHECLDSIDKLYALQRGLFSKEEVSSLLGKNVTDNGYAKLFNKEEHDSDAAQCTMSDYTKLGLLDSSQYLRNQLLRDGDWASMSHSVELRTPLVDYHLLSHLSVVTNSFINGKGKKFLSNSLRLQLPKTITQSKKTGFGLPMGSWLKGTDKLYNSNLNDNMPWAKLWAIYILKYKYNLLL